MGKGLLKYVSCKAAAKPMKKTTSVTITKGCVGLSKLEKRNPLRDMVEKLFRTSWGPRGFSGCVETVFQIENTPRLSAGFENYRKIVKLRAGCMADGNQMMMFHCRSDVLSTYNRSRVAHDTSTGCGVKGRQAMSMIVSQVIAGRVSERVGLVDPAVVKKCFRSGEFDSVMRENGELVVFDSRAVLPCFIVMYTL